jgi:SAM-dependent methyltransferase
MEQEAFALALRDHTVVVEARGLVDAIASSGDTSGTTARRVVAQAATTAELARELVAVLDALVTAGIASQLVVVSPPPAVGEAVALLGDALVGFDHLDVDVVPTDSPAELLEPDDVFLSSLQSTPAGVTAAFFRATDRRSGGATSVVEGQAAQKYAAELAFWGSVLDQWVAWYQGEGPAGGAPPPSPEDRTTEFDLRTNAAVTFSRVYQEAKYVTDLMLHPYAFRGQRVLDIGCGPAPSLLGFKGADCHGIDPLVDAYREIGFPLDLWETMGFTYHCAPAEAMPLADDSFDAVVSVNAIDHIDDFAGGAAEIRRVLRPGGSFRMHVHYHSATETEPLELNDSVFLEHYGWVPGLRRIAVSDTKDSGMYTALAGEQFVLWGNR